MILRGIGLPCASLRWPDSIRCETSVLIWMISPCFASFGSLIRGLSAMSVSPVSAAAAADSNLDGLALGEERAIAHFCDHDDVLRLREADANRRLGLAGQRRERQRCDAGIRIAV